MIDAKSVKPCDMLAGWVLWWRYHDGSGQEIVRAYTDGGLAQRDFDLVRGSDGKQWHLDAIEMTGAASTSMSEDPRAAEKQAVVEAAVAWIDQFGRVSGDGMSLEGRRMQAAVAALHAAMAPPDPVAELEAAWDAAETVLADKLGRDAFTVARRMRAAIAAVQATRRSA